MTFSDPDAYLSFLETNPALTETIALGVDIASDVRNYLLHDLVRRDGEYVSSCLLDAVRADGGQVMIDSDVLTAASTPAMPTTLLWAPRGLLNQTPGLLPPDLVETARLGPGVVTEFVPDCNHYSIVFAEHALERIHAAALGEG